MAKITNKKTSVTSATLELSIDEITFLKDILNNVGGSPTYSRRKIADGIQAALQDVVDTHPKFKTPDIEGEIMFLDVKDKDRSYEKLKKEHYEKIARDWRNGNSDIDEEVPF